MNRMTGNVGFDEDIKNLFRSGDRDCMLDNSFPPFDLWKWLDVRDSASRIFARLKAGDMPPDGAWPATQLDLFAAWIAEGSPKRRGSIYSDFFKDLDSYTEYWDLYRPDLNGKYMTAVKAIFQKVITPWRAYALAGQGDLAARKDALLAVLNTADVKGGVLLLDQLTVDLVGQHFSFDAAGEGARSLMDAQLCFGADVLPLDPERDARVPAGDPRKPFAKFHRMDGAIMWFNWTAHLECAVLLRGEADPGHPVRTALMAAICGGCSMDFTFRDGRLSTRPEYKRDDATAVLIRTKVQAMLTDWTAAALECHTLFGIAAKPMMANKFFAEDIGRNLT